MHFQALKSMQKRCRGAGEEYMRLVEQLDAMTMGEQQQGARAKRKSAVDKINAMMDKADGLQSRAEELMQNQ